MKFSKRVSLIEVSPITKYNEYAKKLEKDGVKIFRLNIGQPNIETDKSYFNALKQIPQQINGYSSPQGLKSLRNIVSEYYNKKAKTGKFNCEDIVITNGASDAIMKTLITLCDIGDNIIVIEPFFADYNIYCQLLDIEMKTILLEQLTEETLTKVVNKNTRAILFSTPNNPTGHIITKEQANIILKVATKNRLSVIADEVYNEIVFTDKFYSFSNYNDQNLIVIDSVSKKFCNCGSRIGFIICQNKQFIKNVTKVNDSKISISNIEQQAVSNLFVHSDEILDNYRKEYKKRLDIVIKYLSQEQSIDYIKPSGGMSILLILPIADSDDFCSWLLSSFRYNNSTLLLTPATSFYRTDTGKNKVRLMLTLEIKELEEAMQLLLIAVKKYKEEKI